MADPRPPRPIAERRMQTAPVPPPPPSPCSNEQARGQQDVDRTTDVYALGIMIYEAIAGHPPFDGKNPVETLSKVVEGTRIPPSKAAPLPEGDPVLDQVCMKAMALESRERFATCAEAPPRPSPGGWKRAPRRRWDGGRRTRRSVRPRTS